ncbi:MAG: hypothetical protein JXB29_06925 [Sedimentisphaerales bacterium]|nr:hypothetical protein [Sedimentisphaerales bacterium]
MKILSKDIIFEVIFLVMIIGFPLSATDDTAKDDFNLRLARAPQPWKTKAKLYPTQQEYEATLEYWAEKYPQLCTVEKRSESLEGLPIFLLKITDKSVADEDKYVVFVTGLHVGGERAGGMAIMHAVEWLLSDDPEAVESRKKQIILVMPIVNPYGFFIKEGVNNSQGIDPYAAGRGRWWDLETLSFKEPQKSPEIMAVKSVVDEYQPEVHADFHGVSLHYPGEITTESRGSAYSNFTLRPWDWRVMEAMIQAGNKAGYGYERLEADAQRILWGPELQPLAHQLWFGRAFFYTAHYGCCKYHTMILAEEVSWGESLVASLQGLLRIGNSACAEKPSEGYPVMTIRSDIGSKMVAWGKKAAQRRSSRVELWQKQANFVTAFFWPQVDCRQVYICATTAQAAKVLAPKPGEKHKYVETSNATPQQFVSNLRKLEDSGINVDAIEAFVEAGPETLMYRSIMDTANPAEVYGRGGDEPIKNGLALLLRIPYPNPELFELRLNGHLLKQSLTDGYQRWYADGFTQVQVNVPPEKSCKKDLYIVTCAYKPQKLRTYGWKVPKVVLDRIKAEKSKK